MKNPSQETSLKGDAIGCLLLFLFPVVLIAGHFVSWSFEDKGKPLAGWLWFPFIAIVVAVFSLINYHAVIRPSSRAENSIGLARSVRAYIAKQVGVLLLLWIAYWIYGMIVPFSGVHY